MAFLFSRTGKAAFQIRGGRVAIVGLAVACGVAISAQRGSTGLDLGDAQLRPETPVAPSSLVTKQLRYRAGPRGLETGGSIQIRFSYILSRFEFSRPQLASPRQEAHVEATCSRAGVKLELEIGKETTFLEGRRATDQDPEILDYGNAAICDLDFCREMIGEKGKHPVFLTMGRYYPITVRVVEGALAPGDSIEVTLGKGKGFRAPTIATPVLRFRVFVDSAGKQDYRELGKTPTLHVRRPDDRRFKITAPLQVVKGVPFDAAIVAKLPYDGLAVDRGIESDYRGEVHVSTTPVPSASKTVSFSEADAGATRMEGLTCKAVGLFQIHAEDRDTGRSGRSHHVECVEQLATPVYWGDLHVHTSLSYDAWHHADPAMAYPWAKRIANLDFAAITDHTESNFDERSFQQIKRLARQHYDPGRFVTFPAFEWSGDTSLGGDHNVFFLEDDPPLFRHVDAASRRVEHLLSLLRKHRAFVIPHFLGRRANWDIDLDAEAANLARRVVEIYSAHQTSEFGEGLTNDGLKRWKLGFIGSGDGHEGHPGDTYNVITDWGLHGGLAAVRAESLTREGIAQAIHDRSCYATSGERVYLEFSADGHPMGSEIRSSGPPVFRVRSFASVPVDQIDIVKSGRVAVKHALQTALADWTWTDVSYDGAPAYYYARVTFRDGERAWSSPIWINADN